MRRILALASLLLCLVTWAAPSFAQAPAAIEAHTNGSNQITVAWSAVPNATGYNLYSSTTNGGPYTLINSTPLTTTSDSLTGFNDTVNEYFTVTAIVAGTESAKSQQASCRSGTPQVAAPTGLTATGGNGQVVLSWNAVTGETNYDIYRQPVTPSNATYLYLGPLSLTATGGVFTYTDTSVTNATAYTYAVAAADGHGEGNLTGWVATTPLAPPSLTAMPEATANGPTEIDLGWTATAGTGGTYTLLRSTMSGQETSYQPGQGLTGTSFNDTGLTTGTKYYYKIKAVSSTGSSATSDEVSATAGGTLLAAPTLSGTASDGQVSLSWTSVGTSSYYDLYRVPNPGTDATGMYQRLSNTTYSYTDTNVTDGASYTYRVAGGNSGGQGTLSNSVPLTPLASPTVTANPNSAPSVSVSWTAITGATSYQLQRETSTSGPWSVLTTTSGTSYTDPNVSFATDYYYCVHALCTGTDSGPGNAALAETCPAKPTNLTATGENGQVVLKWTEPSGDVGGVSVYKGTTSGGEGSTYIMHGVLGSTYIDTSVTAGQTYFYNIAATDLGGASARSSEVSAAPVNNGSFILSEVPSSITITHGQHASVTVVATSLNNFTGTLQYTVSGAPAGAAVWLYPSTTIQTSIPIQDTSLHQNSTTTLFINTGTAAVGTYALTVTGTANGLQAQQTMIFTIN